MDEMDLIGMRWGDLPEDLRQLLLSTVTLGESSGIPCGDDCTEATLIFEEWELAIIGKLAFISVCGDKMIDVDISVDEDAVFFGMDGAFVKKNGLYS